MKSNHLIYILCISLNCSVLINLKLYDQLNSKLQEVNVSITHKTIGFIQPDNYTIFFITSQTANIKVILKTEYTQYI